MATLTIILNIVLAVFILVAVVAPLALSIRSAAAADRVAATPSRRRVRRAVPAARRARGRLIAEH